MISSSTVTLNVSQVNVFCVKFVDQPEFGLVLAQLDNEASLIGKFHSNPPRSF